MKKRGFVLKTNGLEQNETWTSIYLYSDHSDDKLLVAKS